MPSRGNGYRAWPVRASRAGRPGGLLHELLLRAARFEVTRRRGSLSTPARRRSRRPRPPGRRRRADGDAAQARQLPRREPLHHLGLQVRAAGGGGEAAPPRLAGPRGPARAGGAGRCSPTGADPDAGRRAARAARGAGEAIDDDLTPHQREVLVALALNGVPIDVLAERLGTTRGALYKTLHDARRKLRAHLAARGLRPADGRRRSMTSRSRSDTPPAGAAARARPARARAARSASRSSTATSS